MRNVREFLTVFLAVLVLTAAGSSAYAALLFEDTFDNGTINNTWNRANIRTPYNLSVVDTPGGRPGKAARFEVRRDGPVDNIGRIRTTLMLPGPTNLAGGIGEERWVGFSLYLPDNGDFADDVYGNHDLFYEPIFSPPLQCPGQSQYLVVEYDQNMKTLVLRSPFRLSDGSNFKAPLSKGRWHDFVLNVKYSTGNDGFYKLWVDGQQVINHTGPNRCDAYIGRQSVSYIGTYRPSWLGGNSSVDKHVLYFDEFRIADGGCGYNDVAPRKQDVRPVRPGENSIYSVIPTTLMSGGDINGVSVPVDGILDGDPDTFVTAHTDPAMQKFEVTIDLGGTYDVSGMEYTPYKGWGTCTNYSVYVSNDPNSFGAAAATGNFPNTSGTKTATFASQNARYMKVVFSGQKYCYISEIDAIKSGGTPVASGGACSGTSNTAGGASPQTGGGGKLNLEDINCVPPGNPVDLKITLPPGAAGKVYVGGLLPGFTLSAGTPVPNTQGTVWEVPVSAIPGLTVTPPSGFEGQLSIGVTLFPPGTGP